MTKKPDIAAVISRNVRELVARYGQVSQKELADRITIPTMVLNRTLRGESTPNADAIVKMAKFFHVSADELLGMKPLSKKKTVLKIAR